MKKLSEEDVAKNILLYLEGQGWNCYPEALLKYSNGRADIAATKDGILRIVEVKMSLSLALLNQANEWILSEGVDEVFIAIPNLKVSHLVSEILRWKGIGMLMHYPYSIYANKVNVVCTGGRRLNVREGRKKKMIDSLHEDMKNYSPGTKVGFSTPYNRTIKRIEEFILEKGCPVTMKEILKLEHHYASSSSARSGLSQALLIFEKDKFTVDQTQKEFLYDLRKES